jgi:hypothetical protein
MSLFRIAAVLSTGLLIATSCATKDATGVSADVTGSWGGSGKQNGVTISFMMTLQESSAGTVVGTGTVTSFTAGGAGYDYDVSGKRDGSSVMLSFVIPGFASPIYQATLQSTTMMEGNVNGSGFVSMYLQLDRS